MCRSVGLKSKGSEPGDVVKNIGIACGFNLRHGAEKVEKIVGRTMREVSGFIEASKKERK